MMTTDTIREILPTVISRSRVLQFQPCRKEELVEWLAAKYLAEDERKLDFAGEISLGRPGVAYKLMEDPAMMDFYKSLYADLTRFLQFNNIFERFAYLQNIVEDRQKINIFLDIFLNILRHKLLTEPAQRARCLAIIERVYEVKRTLRVPVNQRLLLEHLMLSF
jgi:hypothetical protein